MADANNGVAPTGEDSVPTGQPPQKVDTPSENKPSAEEQARREQQSKKDKVTAENSDLSETVEFLSAKEAERARDSYVGELVSDKSKYPNVDANDTLFKYATSKEEVEEIAKDIQNRFTTLQQQALHSVQSEPETLTDEQIVTKEKELEEAMSKDGTSKFGSFMDTISRRKR